MSKGCVVHFASRRIRGGEINRDVLAVGYAAAWMKAASAPHSAPTHPPPIGSPRKLWQPGTAEVGGDDGREVWTWGDAQWGLEVAETPFLPERTLWRTWGLPAGCSLNGEAYLPRLQMGRAGLDLVGPDDWRSQVEAAFQTALAPWVFGSEGPTAAEFFLERALTERAQCPATAFSERELDEAERVLAGSASDQATGLTLRFFVAVASLALGRRERAEILLHELGQQGTALLFSHPLTVTYHGGKPFSVRWREEFSPQLAEIRLAHLCLQAAQGQAAAARASLRRFPKRADAETREQAARLLQQLRA